LPNGSNLTYTYGENDLVGLTGVTYPTGPASTFSTTPNPDINMQMVTYDDAGAVGEHRRKDVFLSTISFNSGNFFINQPANRLRQIVNGNGEFVYYNWNAVNNNVFSLYAYVGGANSGGTDTSAAANAGTLIRYDTTLAAVPIASYRAVTWDPTQSPDTYTWELIESYTADGQLRVTSRTDNLNRQTSYTRDPVSGAILAEARLDSNGATYASESTTYNQFRQPLVYTDRLGRITKYVYDNTGNMLSKTVAFGTPEQATWSWTFNGRGQPLTMTDANNNITTYHYDDPRGFLTSVVEPPDVPNGPSATKQYAYDAAGRLQTTTDAVARTTSFAYDTRSRIQLITYNDNSNELFVYGTNQNGNFDANMLVAFRDRNGTVTQMECDNAGRKTISAVTMPDSSLQDLKEWGYRYGMTLPTQFLDRGNVSSYAYDYRNRLISTTVRPNGDTTKNLTSLRHFDSNDRVDFETDPYGRRTFYVYDVEDRVLRTVRETVPGGVTDTTQLATMLRDNNPNAAYLIDDLAYDVESQITEHLDARGIGSTFGYDHQGRATVSVVAAEKLDNTGSKIAITNPTIAARTENTYDLQGNLIAVKLPRTFAEVGQTFQSTFSYTGRNLLASATAATGRPETATTQYTYYLDRRPKDTIDARGNTWTKVWKQCCGRLGATAEPALADGSRPTSLFEYDFYGMPTHVTRVKNINPLPTCCLPDPVDADTMNEVTTKYDARHRPIAQTVWLAPLGSVDENNPPIAGDNGVPAANGLTTRWQYDDDLTDGAGLDAIYAQYLTGLNFGQFGVGYAAAVTNPAGETSVAIYDGLYRVVRTIDPLGHASTVTYDSVVAGTPGAPGNLVETTFSDPLNHTGKARLDGAGRRLASIDAESNLSSYAYDANGNTLSMRDPNGVGIDCSYDERDRNLSCTDTHGDVTSRTFDAHSNVITSTDALNHAMTCAYDGRNRKISCLDRINGLTTYTYDTNNNLLTIEDADANVGNTGKQTLYTYDPRNLMTTETFPDNGSRTYTYDGADRVSSRLDQKNELTSYVYDYANRLTSRSYPDALNDSFTYDAASRMLTAVSARYGNTVTRTYDLASRLSSDTLSIGATNYAVQYGYDNANRQTSVTYPDSSVVARTFTNRNQVQTISFNNSSVASRTYDPGMRLSTTTFGNNLNETRTYRTDGALKDNLTSSISIPGVTNFSYTWDANKRKKIEADTSIPTNTQNYDYDNEDRLTSFSRDNGDSQTWNLSLVGDWNTFNANGILQTRTHDFVHELTAINAAPLTYDLKGNLTQNSNAQTYTWDYENRMKSAVVGADTATYTYDSLGRRVSKTFQGATTVFVNDGIQEIAEYTSGTLAREYVFGPYSDEPLMMKSGGQSYYYQTNNQYSVAALTDSNGTVVERYKYDPYGKATVLAPDGMTVRSTSSYGNPYQWQGGRVALETGLNYKRARYYSTDLGRFINRDPIGYQGGINLYAYCCGAPLDRLDPSGNDWMWAIGYSYSLDGKIHSAPRWVPIAGTTATLYPSRNGAYLGDRYTVKEAVGNTIIASVSAKQLPSGETELGFQLVKDLHPDEPKITGITPDAVNLDRIPHNPIDQLLWAARNINNKVPYGSADQAVADAAESYQRILDLNKKALQNTRGALEDAFSQGDDPAFPLPDNEGQPSNYDLKPPGQGNCPGKKPPGNGNGDPWVTPQGDDDRVKPYEVGSYKDLSGRSRADSMEIHHVPQANAAAQVIPGFDYNNGPAIVLPEREHWDLAKYNLKGDYTGSPQDLIEKGVSDVQNHTNVMKNRPEAIQELNDLIKQTYPSLYNGGK
jgi:RHS repeat-associated protein